MLLRSSTLLAPLAAGLTAGILCTGIAASAATVTATAARPFASSSSFNTPLPAGDAIVDQVNTPKVRAAASSGLYSNLVEFGIPVFTAATATPTYTIGCSRSPEWGTCPFNGLKVPVPAAARPHVGSDGAMVVVDTGTRKVYEFWQARKSGSGWATSWGSVSSLDSSGWGSTATGAGASRLAGLVRIDEIRAGTIRHALVLQSNNVCAKTVLAPATKTDGDSTRSTCLPEGTRVQLDPKLDLTRLNLPSGERAVAKALQTYGAFLVDRGGTGLSVSFELDPTASGSYPGSTYGAAGFGWDYDNMPAIPWGSALRVVKP